MFVFFSQQLSIGDESNTEAPGEFSRLLDKKDFGKDESVALSSLPSGGTVNQQPESISLTSRESMPLPEERIEVGVDPMGFTLFQVYFSRIFEVVARGDNRAPSILQNNSMTKVNTTESQGNTALHRAVLLAYRKGDRGASLYRCIDDLMKSEQMNLNMPNKKGYTAIGCALNALNSTCIERMLEHSSASCLYLDYYPGDR